MKASKHPLFHRFLHQLKELNISRKKILAACSGGLDSLVLLDLIHEASPLLSLKIKTAYVHHGMDKNQYRDLAQSYVYLTCLALDCPFLTNFHPPSQGRLSEAHLRSFRYRLFQKWMLSSKSDYLALAHTANDLMETRLMRMIRGTGAEGLISMKIKDGFKLRPLLAFTRKEIQEYAVFRKITPLEDPTNQQTDFFRNWVRRKWLVQLEKHQSKSILNLSRSLEKIASAVQPHSTLHLLSKLRTRGGLNKAEFIKLSKKEQKQILVQYMKTLNLKNYKESHVQEILKNLYKNGAKIKILGKTWSIHQRTIKVN